jgi:hypothetical protein
MYFKSIVWYICVNNLCVLHIFVSIFMELNSEAICQCQGGQSFVVKLLMVVQRLDSTKTWFLFSLLLFVLTFWVSGEKLYGHRGINNWSKEYYMVDSDVARTPRNKQLEQGILHG